MPKQLEVSQVRVAYGERTVVHQAGLELEPGEIACLLGPSGCGKTTLLRAIAGFEPVSAGTIRLRGRNVSTTGQALPPEERRVGMVFQDFALFPHLSVERNVAFGLRGLAKRQRLARVEELLALTGMEETARHYPHQLSGGQQQRIALARAMAPRPDILLLDEPFSSMDAELREQLAREVRALLQRAGSTAILVTHDQLEAFAMADQISVMFDGRIHQTGTGFDLYHKPADRSVADFIGQGVMLPARVLDARRVETELGVLSCHQSHGLPNGAAAEVLLRPDDLLHDDTAALRAEVVARAFRGAGYLYTLRLPSGANVLCLVPSRDHHTVGERIGIRPDPAPLVVFPAPGY